MFVCGAMHHHTLRVSPPIGIDRIGGRLLSSRATWMHPPTVGAERGALHGEALGARVPQHHLPRVGAPVFTRMHVPCGVSTESVSQHHIPQSPQSQTDRVPYPRMRCGSWSWNLAVSTGDGLRKRYSGLGECCVCKPQHHNVEQRHIHKAMLYLEGSPKDHTSTKPSGCSPAAPTLS